jgi:hypothetical protein
VLGSTRAGAILDEAEVPSCPSSSCSPLRSCGVSALTFRARGIPRVDDRRVLSGIIFVIKGGLRWRDAPPGYGPHKTLQNRFVR